MKKLTALFIFLICLTLNNLKAQTGSLKNIAGLWASDSTSVKLNFYYNKRNKLHLTIRDTTSGEKMKIRRFETINDTVQTIEKFRSTRWSTRNKYYLIAQDTIENIITGDANTTIYFKRVECFNPSLIISYSAAVGVLHQQPP